MNRGITPLLLVLAVAASAAAAAKPTATPPSQTKSPSASQPAPSTPVRSPGKELTLDLGNGLNLELVLIPAGEFLMGSPTSEKDRKEDEGPQHKVRIVSPFYLGKYEITNRQYRGFQPAHHSGRYEQQELNGDTQPAVMVRWEEARAFCQWASQKTRRTVRLPSEAEWEYAARAGDGRRYFWGQDPVIPPKADNFADATARKAFPNLAILPDYDDGFAVTAPVGSFKPTPFGLYDLAGNAWEWCLDAYYHDFNDAPVDGAARLGSGAYRVVRGHCCANQEAVYRIARRTAVPMDKKDGRIGFRVVVPIDPHAESDPWKAAEDQFLAGVPASERPRWATTLPAAYGEPLAAPADWPALQEGLQGEEWKKRYQKSRAALRPVAKADDGRPVLGVLIVDVASGSKADVLGLKTGDCVTAVDGQPLTSSRDFHRLRLDRSQKVGVWTAEWGHRTVEVGPGMLGIDMRQQWAPRLAYLRSKTERKPAWEDLLRVATETWESDEHLAETALYHAYQAGYRGWLIPALMASLTQRHGRSRETLAWSTLALKVTPKEYRQRMIDLFCDAAMMNGRLELAADMNQQEGHRAYFPDDLDLPAALQRYRQLTGDQKTLPAPCLAAPARPLLTPASTDTRGQYLIECIKTGSQVKLDHRYPILMGTVGPATRNLALLVEYKIGVLQDPQQGTPLDPQVPSRLSLGLTDPLEGPNKPLLEINLMAGDRQIAVLPRHYPMFLMKSDALLGPGVNRLEAAVLGPWFEVRMNGRRVFLGLLPDSPTRKLVSCFTFVHLQGSITRYELRDLGGAPAAPKLAAASQPAATAPGTLTAAPPAPKEAVLAWYHQAMVEGYLKQGRRNPAWDEAAVTALSVCGEVLNDRFGRVGELWVASRKALDAGCDDPVVLYAHSVARIYAEADYTGAISLRRQVADQIKASGYAPALRFFILADIAGDSLRLDPTGNKWYGTKKAQDALPLLAEALADKECPHRPLIQGIDNLVALLPPPVKDQPASGLEQICEQIEKIRPGSIFRPLARARFYVDFAWKARGGGWASSVTTEGWKLFHERLQIAADACAEAWSKDDTDPTAPTLMISIALGHDEVRKDIDQWLNRALANERNNRQAGTSMLWFLRPRWGGSSEKMLAFARTCVDRAQSGFLHVEMMGLLPEAYKGIREDQEYASATSLERTISADDYWRSPELWQELSEVHEELLKRFPGSTYYQSSYAAYAGQCFQWKKAWSLLQTLGEAALPAPFGGSAELVKLRARAEREVKAAEKP